MQQQSQEPEWKTGWLHAGLIAFVCVGAGYLVRLGVDRFIHGQVPFVTFFPAIIGAALFGGTRAGFLTMVFATPLAVFGFGSLYPVATMIVWILPASMIAVTVGSLRGLNEKLRLERDELEKTRAKLELVVREQGHRAKNTFAVLNAVAAQSAQTAQSVEEFRDRLIERVRAISTAYSLVSQSEEDAPLELDALVEAALAPFRDSYGARLMIGGGPAVRMAPSSAIPLSLCLNELATNAVKYGALSTLDGQILCDWLERSPNAFTLRWREKGGPAVKPPLFKGFGSKMIQAALGGVPGGSANLRYEPMGLECDLSFDGA